MAKNLVTDQITISVGYDKENIKTDYSGEAGLYTMGSSVGSEDKYYKYKLICMSNRLVISSTQFYKIILIFSNGNSSLSKFVVIHS